MKIPFKTLLLALLVVITFSGVSGAVDWTSNMMYAAFQASATVPLADGDNIIEFINIPPDQNGAPLAAGLYTLVIPAGATITFTNQAAGFAIIEQDYDVNHCVGRILADGAENNRIHLLKDPDWDGWAGIRICTNPAGVNDNLLDYCELQNASVGGAGGPLAPAIYICADENNPVATISNCEIHGCVINGQVSVGGLGIKAVAGEYYLERNEIYDEGYGIICENALMAGTDMDDVLARNVIYDCDADLNVSNGWGIMVSDDWDANIYNNVVFDCRNGISAVGVDDIKIINNTVAECADPEVGNDRIGLLWDNINIEVRNNLVHDFEIGYDYTGGGGNADVFYCCASDIDINEWVNVDTNNCYEFLADLNNNLGFPCFPDGDSPCIDAGDPAAAYYDRNHSRNDLGGYGGPNSIIEMREYWFGVMVPGNYVVSTDVFTPPGYLCNINSGTTLWFANDCGYFITGDLQSNGGAGQVVFTKTAAGLDWQGIWFSGVRTRNSFLFRTVVKEAEDDGISIDNSWVALIDECWLYDNGCCGLSAWDPTGPITITETESHDNANNGLTFTAAFPRGQVTLEDNELYHNTNNGLWVQNVNTWTETNMIWGNDDYGIWQSGTAIFNMTQDRVYGNNLVLTAAVKAGLGFAGSFPVLFNVWSTCNCERGMNVFGAGTVDMWRGGLGGAANALVDNGWPMGNPCVSIFPRAPVRVQVNNVEELWVTLPGNVLLNNGNNDIWDRNPNGNPNELIGTDISLAGNIAAATSYTGTPPMTTNPVNMFLGPFNAGPNTTAEFEAQDAVVSMLKSATSLLEFDNPKDICESNYRDALGILTDILEDYPESAYSCSAPIIILLCVQALELDPSYYYDYFGSIATHGTNSHLDANIEHVKNVLLMDMGRYDEAITNFRDCLAVASSDEEKYAAEYNLAFAMAVRDMKSGNREQAAGRNFCSMFEKALNGVHVEECYTSATENIVFGSIHPNPFNSTTTISYSLPEQSKIRLSIFDLNGREVTVLHEGLVKAGNYKAVWSADDLPSGLYWCKLASGKQISTMKLVLIK